MTSSVTHRPRHARADHAVPGWPQSIEVPTQRIPVVAPARPVPMPIPHGYPAWTPPAGLAPGHPPIRRIAPTTVIVAVMLMFAAVALIVLAALVDGAADSTGSAGSDAPSSSSVSGRIAAWSDGGGMTHMVAITDDLDAIADAARTYDVSGMNSACRSLQSDVESAQAYDPVPDAQVQSSWSSALVHGARAATYCIAGTSSMDADMIEMSGTEMSQMTQALDEGAARLNAISGT